MTTAVIVANTQGDLFWIGEILLNELAKETGYRGPSYWIVPGTMSE